MRHETVTIHHPTTDATSTVDGRSVPGWQRAGWSVGEKPASSTRRRRRSDTQTPADQPETPDAGASTTEEE
ncbi:hypothetical protein [Isoptericola aurantiacus]|uniref:hypothetical protein n=1 Tax=Isoptericola aurantiacus TaxID=3377839 RepID=UPI003839F004